jgi:preprotein translocase subunit YajC
MFDLTHLFIGTALAQTAAPAIDAPGSTSSIGMSFLPLLLIFGVFYLLLIRPQQKKMDELSRMVKSLKRGDRVVTAGGIHGKISKVLDDNENVMVEIADGVQVKVVRSTISGLAAKTEPVAAKSDEPSADNDKKE